MRTGSARAARIACWPSASLSRRFALYRHLDPLLARLRHHLLKTVLTLLQGDRGAVNEPEIEAVDLLARYGAAMVLDAAHLRQVKHAVGSSDPAGRCACLRGNTGIVFRRHAVHLLVW